MKDIIQGLDKAFENRHRLGVMSVLSVNEWVEFNELKLLLDLTDGNLASHISALEKRNLVETRKQFVGKKPNTAFRMTQEGRTAFQNHLQLLEQIIKSRNGEAQ